MLRRLGNHVAIILAFQTIAPHRFQVTLPMQLTAKMLNFRLLTEAEQSLQTQLNHLTLGLETRCTQGVLHESVVNLDV
jgi:hypothetical protein